ncbi:hypothetical protein JCM10908_005343 [Rhodotorula pacifica]|uniref:uncharacterized protein n=1 Tax=Rhodotorula pacifica TaxID=1495444 RepID=UPI0031798EE4
MRTIVIRLDPTTFDPVASASAPGESESAALNHTWNAWNSKARGLLEQDSRIENLYWRRWHMERRRGIVGPALHSPSLQSGHADIYGLQSSVEAHERRKATEDLEAFLRTTLQQAQPSDRVPPQPPTFGGPVNNGSGRPGPGSRKGSSVTPRPPSVASLSGTQTPSLPPAQPPTTIHAPQARLPFQPSPDWTYAALPPVSTSGHTGIVSTPSWTAVIPAASSGLNGGSQVSAAPLQAPPSVPASSMPSSSSLGQGSTPAYAAYQSLQTPTAVMPSDPFAFAAAAANASGSGPPSAFPFASTSSATMPSPSFPPNATIFSDLPAALSSAPPIGAPPAFFSSYGMYQPVIAPYPRFLTPSPEPSVLGELELELGPAAGEFVPNDDGLDEVWKDLEERDGNNGGMHAGSDGLIQPKKDPFEGMTLAQMRSRANSLEAVDRAAARYNPFADGDAQISSAAEEVRLAAQAQAMNMSVSPPQSDEASSTSAGPGKKAKRKASGANGAAGGANSKKNRAANTVTFSADVENDNPDGSKPVITGRKNRNPHSTQLPGPRRNGKVDGAEEGHEGPICSHCSSVTTPLWRRGPDDELLCNACGLYLKLHGKSRPKTFGKSGAPRKAATGAAAQAASSGVPPSCNNCGATSTPMWRKDADGNLCCNACSLYYKLHKVNRPASLAQKRAAAAAAKANAMGSATSSTAVSPQAGPSGHTPIAPAPGPVPIAPAAPSSSAKQLPTPAASTEVTPASAQGTPAAPVATPATPILSLPPIPVSAAPPPPNAAGMGASPHPGFYPPPPHLMDPAAAAAHHHHLQFHPQQPMWPPHPFAPAAYPPYPPPYPPLPPQQGQPPHPQHQQQQQQQQQMPSHQQAKYSLPPTVPQHPMSPHQLPATPFAQTAWGQLAYGIVAAAAEEAHVPSQSTVPGASGPQQQQLPSHPNGHLPNGVT